MVAGAAVVGGAAYYAGKRRGAAQGEVDQDAGLDQFEAQEQGDVESTQESGSVDMDQLQQFAKLHEEGVLTDEEFAAEKAKILGI
jgi:hypothetical protein